MISVHKFSSAAGALNYYSQGAHGESVEKAADYYHNLAWSGRGAAIAGFEGEVARDDFMRTLEGAIPNPESGELQYMGKAYRDLETGELMRDYNPGHDLTISPPKSFSIVGLVGGDERIVELQPQAVAAAMDYLQDHAATTRLTDDGHTRYVETGNLLFATEQHGTNRENEPQLHTHVVVASVTWSEEREEWRALNERPLYRELANADGVYKEVLAEKAMSLGYDINRTENGPEIAGISRADIEAFSTRTARIDNKEQQLLAERGWTESNWESRRDAVLGSRAEKEHLPFEELKGMWDRRADRHEIDVQSVVEQARERAAAGERGRDLGYEQSGERSAERDAGRAAEGRAGREGERQDDGRAKREPDAGHEIERRRGRDDEPSLGTDAIGNRQDRRLQQDDRDDEKDRRSGVVRE